MDQVRMGVIGCGIMARIHMKTFANITGIKFTAVADAMPDAAAEVAKEYGIQAFSDGESLIDSGLVDAVLIAVPHYFHPPLAIAALKAGLHVLVEKPIAVTAKAAAEMNAVAEAHPKLVYAAMFQQRTFGLWRQVKQLMEDGRVGDLMRVNWVITTWFRTQAYYDSGSWRATWAGEGGGVLLNQCPHNLDMLQWLVGLPSKVTANVGLGKYHNIEVEDAVTAMFEFPNGATGTFVTTTAEVPGVNRLEIVGDKATLIVEAGRPIELWEHVVPVSVSRSASDNLMRVPSAAHITIEPSKNPVEGHQAVTQNFVNAILHGEKLIAPAQQGIAGLELSNAMLMSGLTGQPVSLPMDREAYHELLQELIEKAKPVTV